jgi:endogenous inhibitor of DNA gyrase (YacG/DUF329 family)
MAWPELVKKNVTCPDCGTTAEIEALHVPNVRVSGNRDRIYESATWADCPECGVEWKLPEAQPAAALQGA